MTRNILPPEHIPNVYRFHIPSRPMPIIFDSPHSGNYYPKDFNYDCNPLDLACMKDRYVEDLFSRAPDHGASLLHALFARSYIDTNRARDDIDPALIEDGWPEKEWGKINPTPRSQAGIGLISRLIRPGEPIYRRKLGSKEIMNRIMTHYDPYHGALKTFIDTLHYRFGHVWHLNCHSMPSASAYPRHHSHSKHNKTPAFDIVLGDLDGKTAGRNFLYSVRDHLRSQGFKVSLNDPFKGVELINRYSEPSIGRHSLQIEVNRALFMNEVTFEKTSNYNAFKEKMNKLIIFCTDFAQNQLTSLAAD